MNSKYPGGLATKHFFLFIIKKKVNMLGTLKAKNSKL